MSWTSEQRQILERENTRIGFRRDDLLPLPADPALAQAAGCLALLATIPNDAGVAGFIEALRRHAAAHPLDETAA